MPEQRKTSTAECKHAAGRLRHAQGDGGAATARNLGLNVHMRRRWRRELHDTPHGAWPGHGRLTPEQEELQRLREAQKRWRMERDILTHATACLVTESSCARPFSSTPRRAG
jgi:transposase